MHFSPLLASTHASNDPKIRAKPSSLQPLPIDDDLLAAAERYTGLKEKSALVREALRAVIERESARRLAALGGSESGLKPVARRKTSA